MRGKFTDLCRLQAGGNVGQSAAEIEGSKVQFTVVHQRCIDLLHEHEKLAAAPSIRIQLNSQAMNRCHTHTADTEHQKQSPKLDAAVTNTIGNKNSDWFSLSSTCIAFCLSQWPDLAHAPPSPPACSARCMTTPVSAASDRYPQPKFLNLNSNGFSYLGWPYF